MTINNPVTARRNTDPATSHDAAAKITSSGARTSQAELVLGLVIERQGLTSGQYAELSWLSQHQVTRRIADLHNAGKVYPDGVAKYEGHSQQRWWLGTDPKGVTFRPHCKSCTCEPTTMIEASPGQMKMTF